MLKWICIYRQSPWKFSSWSVQPVWPHSVVNSGVDFVLDVSSAFDRTNREKTTRAEKDRIGALSLIFSLFGSPLCSRTRVRCLLWHKMKLLLLQVNYFRIHCVLLSLWFPHLPRKQYTSSPNRNMDFIAADTWYLVYLRSLFIFRTLMDHLVLSYTTLKYVSSVFSIK